MPEKPQVEGLHAAIEMTKQIITLSTGVIAIMVTFFDKFGPEREVPWTLLVAWGFYGMAIIAAIATIGGITGTLNYLDRRANGIELDEKQSKVASDLLNGTNIKWPALVMVALFVLATGFTIATGFSLQ
jgi:hypothetical protein